jgi:hypothetical protein
LNIQASGGRESQGSRGTSTISLQSKGDVLPIGDAACGALLPRGRSLKIALLDAFPLKSCTAEREFITRCIGVLEKLGHQAISVSTTRQIAQYDPDIVFSTHDFAPKLTEHFTIGALWSPTLFYKDDRERLRNIRSWDLVVPIDETTRQFAIDLHFPMRHRTAVSEHNLCPSAPIIPMELPSAPKLSLAYIGVHWDGRRHEAFFRRLAKEIDLHVYGPEEAWKFLPSAYRGPIPFDGKALFETLNRHGVVLALHKETHRREAVPSMRPFEACAAKCLVITDSMPPLKDIFGDSFSYVDMETGAERAVRQIEAAFDAANRDRTKAEARIEAAHRIFCERFSLDVLLPSILEEAKEKISRKQSVALRVDGAPTVSVIIRCGGRPLRTVSRAVDSIKRQLYPRISLVFARFAPIAGFDQYVSDLRTSNRFDDVEVHDVGGRGRRSESLWTGLKAVKTPFFAVLDDDDEWFPDHLHHLMEILERDKSVDLVHSGGIRHDEEGHSPELHPRLQRQDGTYVDEQRVLTFCDAQDVGQLMAWRNVILSHSFVARSELLVAEVLEDPQLDVSEDVYLYLIFIAHGARFAFNGRATAIWNWRARSGDNSMIAFDVARRPAQCERIIRRLEGYRFPGNLAFPTHGESALARDLAAAEPPLARDVSAAEAELAAFKASTSWRITAPLRRFVIFLRGPTPAAAVLARGLSVEAELAAIKASTCWRITAPLRLFVTAFRASTSWRIAAPLWRLANLVR